MFYFRLIFITKIIKPEAVSLLVHQRNQLVLKLLALGSVHHALEDGVLYPLAVVDALPGN